MIIVTGGAGFIGSNVVRRLNRLGECDILLVDVFTSRTDPKRENLKGTCIAGYMDKDEFRDALASGAFDGKSVRAILHQGAYTDTLSDDSRSMIDNNFGYSKEVLAFAQTRGVPFVYASTAAVYGDASDFAEREENECPASIYGFSKLLFDNYVRALQWNAVSSVVGLRYFNVYGPGEQHKGRMASLVHQFAEQLSGSGTIRAYAGSGGVGNGEQSRDFVFVDDVVEMSLYFAGLLPEYPPAATREIFNAGTGRSRTINELATILMSIFDGGRIEYIPFPPELMNRYQNFTQADLTLLRRAGYATGFHSLEEGVARMLKAQGISFDGCREVG